MINEANVIVPDLGSKANDMTHGLKVHGNGSMLEGIRNMCIDAYRAGEKSGIKKGIAYGVMGTVAVALTCEGIQYICSKLKDLNKESNDEDMLTKGYTEEEIRNAQRDYKFPWEKVKSHMYMKYDIDPISFETWIDPLVCNAYKDRILLEFPSAFGTEISYIKERYKRLVKNSVFEVTGKNYIVSFVRPGEILIEDDN